MQTISNPDRGCGNLVEGGFYLQATFSRQGDLLPVTWALGHNIYGGQNLSMRVPPREDLLIDPEMTIDRCDLVHYTSGQAMRMAGEYLGSGQRQLQRLGDIALIDHVGMNNYTAWSFASEVMKFGPSRKIAPKMAKLIADSMPMRIFFTADIPIFKTAEQRDDYIRATGISLQDNVGYEPTWKYDAWGARLDEYDDADTIPSKSGSWNYTIPILKHLDKEKEWLDIQPIESVYFFSWITKVCYIVPSDQDEADVPDDILNAGIVPVRAAPKGVVVD